MGSLKNKRRWLLPGVLGLLALLVVVALVLPRLVDVESYRDFLRSSLEQQLGRDVDFGAMELSLWPVPGLRLDDLVIGRGADERFEKPVVAERLRVGARLFPLLRGRLEVTSLIVEAPVLTLFRRDDGTWEPRLSTAAEDSTTPSDGSPLIIEKIRIKRARVVLRRDDGSRVRETTLDDLTLRLDGLGSRVPISFELSTDVGASGKLRVSGTGSVAELEARVELQNMDPTMLREWLAVLAPTVTIPPDLLIDRSFSSSAKIDYRAGTPAQLEISDAVVRGPGLFLMRSTTGTWNYESLFDTDTGVSVETPEPMSIHVSGLTLEDASVRIEDRPAGGRPEAIDLSLLRLTLRQPRPDTPIDIEIDARGGIEGQAKPGARSGAGKLALRGNLGPLAADPAATPLDLSLTLEAFPPDSLRFLLPTMESLDASKATVALDLRLSGTFARVLKLTADASLSNATVSFASPAGQPRTLPLDVRARADIELHDSAARIELPRLELELPRKQANGTMTFQGTVNATSDPPHVDLKLLPTRVAADDLAVLAALFAPDAPLSFASAAPVELELRARGPLGSDVLPDLEGRATLSGFTFRFAGMAQPMEKVGATVRFSPNRITLDGLEGTIGKSDVTASSVTIRDFDAPRIELDLNSRNADFWELFSFVESDDSSTDATQMSRLTIEGMLRIERGSLDTLAFEKLTTGIDLRAGVLTLAPLEMNLYSGRFAGKIVQDLSTGGLTIDGGAAAVEADGFLMQNLDLGGLISGRASTQLGVQVRAVDPANLLAGVSGGGPLQLVDGRLAKLDMLKSLSKVTGIFGERSLQRLTRQLASTGTPFQRAETRLNFDSGTLVFEDLVLETAEFSLAGRAALESATGKLDGRFALAFSPELSATMREDQSRAAKVFWDPQAQRVSLPFGVSGSATSPSVSVDWDRALRGVAERKLGDRLRSLVERKPTTEPPPGADEATGTPSAVEPAGPETTDVQPETGGPPAELDNLFAEITSTRWTGSVLVRDLSLAGNVRGAGIERASLVVIDTRGIAVQQIDRLRSVDDQLATVSDRDAEATWSWTAVIDGKRLLVARFPLKVTLTVYDRQGRSSSATREVER